MSQIITEEMRLRKRIVEYAIKHDNNAQAARRYHTSRQNVKRWRDRYDGSWDSLRNKSTRPKSHPNQHTRCELKLIRKTNRRYGHEGLAEVYVQCKKKGYRRSYENFCKQIRERSWRKRRERPTPSYPKSKWKPEPVTSPGERVQIDIKYVPFHCLAFNTFGKRYYQITAIDEYSRKRYCEIVDEKSVTHTARFLLKLEEGLGFKVKMVQTDNGREFTNDSNSSERLSLFERTLQQKGIAYRKTRPYSPWQNGVVERSHRQDSEQFYNRRRFKSLEELQKAHRRYINRGNNVHRKVLDFKSPNEKVQTYFGSFVA